MAFWASLDRMGTSARFSKRVIEADLAGHNSRFSLSRKKLCCSNAVLKRLWSRSDRAFPGPFRPQRARFCDFRTSDSDRSSPFWEKAGSILVCLHQCSPPTLNQSLNRSNRTDIAKSSAETGKNGVAAETNAAVNSKKFRLGSFLGRFQ